jgi:hypothetical protein
MGRYLALIAPAGLVVAAILFHPRAGAAKPEYSRRTKKECGFCHPKDSWDVNEAGRYFRDHQHSLEGYKPSGGGAKSSASRN